MNKVACLFIVILLSASCTPSGEAPTSDVTAIPTATASVTPIPVPSLPPTNTPLSPTATLPPINAVPVSASPWTLTEFNAGTEMRRLNIIGTGTPHDLEFSPDGKLFAVATGRGIYLYDGVTFEQTGFIDVNDSVSAIAFSPEGHALAVAVNGKASLWSVRSGQKLLDFKGEMVYIAKLVYGRGGYVAAMGADCRGCGEPVGAMILWNAQTGNRIYDQRDIWYETSALLFSADGTWLIFGGKQGATAIESSTGRLFRLYGGVPGMNVPYDLMFNNDESRFMISTYRFHEFTGLVDPAVDTAGQEKTWLSHCGLHFTRAKEMGACSKQKSIVLIDGLNGQELNSFEIDVDADTLGDKFALSPEGDILAYHGKYGINILETRTGSQIKNLVFTDFASARAGFVEIDGIPKYAAAVQSPPGQIRVLDLQTGDTIRTLQLDCCEITGFAFAPDQKTAATLSEKTLQIWDMTAEQVIHEVDLVQDYSDAIAFSPNGSKVYLTDFEDNVWELDVQTNQRKRFKRTSYAHTYANPFAPDHYPFNQLGNLMSLEFETDDGAYVPIFRDIVTNEAIRPRYRAFADADFPETFALSRDGKYIAFGNANGIYVWDALTMEQLWLLDKHQWRGGDGWIGAIRSLQFNPQSNLLVSVGWDETIRLWSVATGNELRTLHVCCSASFTPDGQYLVTTGDGVLRVWGIPH